jgi:hypothetical protein
MCRRLAIRSFTNGISTFAFLFIVGPVSSIILFKKQQNMMRNSEYWWDYTTTLPEWLAGVNEFVNIAIAHVFWTIIRHVCTSMNNELQFQKIRTPDILTGNCAALFEIQYSFWCNSLTLNYIKVFDLDMTWKNAFFLIWSVSIVNFLQEVQMW